jgi:hypothetical protein
MKRSALRVERGANIYCSMFGRNAALCVSGTLASISASESPPRDQQVATVFRLIKRTSRAICNLQSRLGAFFVCLPFVHISSI